MKRKIIRVCFVLFLLALPLFGWRAYLALNINHELAKIHTAGLPTNGEELNRWYAAVPDNQNAALVLTQAFALRRNYPDNRSNLVDNFKLPGRGEALSPEHVELLKGYLALNEARRKKADKALALPACRYPIDCTMLLNTLLPHLSRLDDLAELHQFAAWVAMHEGDPAPAITNITTILALARTLDQEPCLISQLVRLRVIGRAFSTLEHRASAGPFSAGEIAILARAFNQTRITNVAAFALIGDRAMTIPYFRMTRAEYTRLNPPKPDKEPNRDSPLACYGPAILKLVGYYELDYATYLMGMNKAIAMASNAPPENLRASSYLARVGEESTKRRRTLSGLLFSGYAGATSRENEGTAKQRLALSALAVESFRNDNGKLPENLDELVSKYFAQLPEDPFNGLALEYRRKDAGYVIYSVGPDREDNHGLEKTDKNQSDDKKSYDITFVVDR